MIREIESTQNCTNQQCNRLGSALNRPIIIETVLQKWERIGPVIVGALDFCSTSVDSEENDIFFFLDIFTVTQYEYGQIERLEQ